MALRERYQNPTPGDTLRLKLFTYNANLPQSVYSVDSIDIYRKDEAAVDATNPEGKVLVETVTTGIVNDAEGSYYCDISLLPLRYIISDYIDSWTVVYAEGTNPAAISNEFSVSANLWYSSSIPIVYDFSFNFQPNRITQGSKQWIIIEVVPNVPRYSELEKYYKNLIISSELKIKISQRCGGCVPQEEDLRVVVDDETVEQRDGAFGYYQIDTGEYDCGLYDIVITLEHGGNTYVSPKNQLLIY